MIRRIISVLFILVLNISASEYRLGRGYEVYKDDSLYLNLGAHLNINYYNSKSGNNVELGQSGLILFGEYTPKFNFLLEIGSDSLYTHDSEISNETTDFHVMRMYGEYLHSDAVEIKVGKFLTPLGIWNRAYIPALRWSGFTPYIANDFFPKIIVGFSLNGSLTENRSFSYSVFSHIDGEHDTNENNLIANEFFGGELRYHLSPLAKISLPFGRYRSDKSKEICIVGGVNILIPFNKNEFSSEFLYKDGEWTNSSSFLETWKDTAWYAQYVQHIYKDSYLSFRYGEKNRKYSSKHINWNDTNSVVGYIYKPNSALNVKVEYRHSDRDGWKPIVSNEVLVSLSVIF